MSTFFSVKTLLRNRASFLILFCTPLFLSSGWSREGNFCKEESLRKLDDYAEKNDIKIIPAFRLKETKREPFVFRYDDHTPLSGILFRPNVSIHSCKMIKSPNNKQVLNRRYLLIRTPEQILKELEKNNVSSLDFKETILKILSADNPTQDFPWIMKNFPPHVSRSKKLEGYKKFKFCKNLAYLQGYPEQKTLPSFSINKKFFNSLQNCLPYATALTHITLRSTNMEKHFEKLLRILPRLPLLHSFSLTHARLEKRFLNFTSSNQVFAFFLGKIFRQCLSLKKISLENTNLAPTSLKLILSGGHNLSHIQEINVTRNPLLEGTSLNFNGQGWFLTGFVPSDRKDLWTPSSGTLFPASGDLFACPLQGQRRYVFIRGPFTFLKKLQENQLTSLEFFNKKIQAFGEEGFPFFMRTPPVSPSDLVDRNLACLQGWDINLRGSYFDSELFEKFLEVLPKATQLRSLEVGKINLSVTGRKDLINTLPKLSALESLNLTKIDFLQSPLKNRPKRKFPKYIFSLLSDSLGHCSQLKKITLENINLTKKSLKSFVKGGIKNCRNLRWLDLSQNNLKNSQRPLISLLKNLPNLEILSLEGCKLEVSFLESVKDCFLSHPSLIEMGLGENLFAEEDMQRIFDGQALWNGKTKTLSPRYSSEKILSLLKELYHGKNILHIPYFYDTVMKMGRLLLKGPDLLRAVLYYKGKKGEKLILDPQEIPYAKSILRNWGLDGLLFAHKHLGLKPFAQPANSPEPEFFTPEVARNFLSLTKQDENLRKNSLNLTRYLVNFLISYMDRENDFLYSLFENFSNLTTYEEPSTPEKKGKLFNSVKLLVFLDLISHLPTDQCQQMKEMLLKKGPTPDFFYEDFF